MSFLEELTNASMVEAASEVGGYIDSAIDELANKIAGMPSTDNEITFAYTLSSGANAISFPSDLDSDYYNERIVFDIDNVISTSSMIANTVVTKPTSSNNGVDEISNSLKTIDTSKREESDKKNQKEKLNISTIHLPIPNNGVGTSYNNSFGEEQMGVLASMQSVNWGNFVSKAGELASAKAVGIQKGAIDTITGSKLGSALLKENRQAINPHVTALYNGVGLRQFNFEFDFTPRSEAELKTALAIAQAFKLASMPELIESGHIYTYPRMFKFYFADRQGNKLQNMYMSEGMWCTSVSMDLTPNSVWTTFMNTGNPTQFKLSLSFIEDKTLTRSDIAKGL